MLNKIASIVPLAHLNLIAGDRYFLALTHLADDPGYLSFYRNKVRDGAYVVLDNSTVELGQPEDPDVYLEKAIAMEASEILLPDWLEDPNKTLAAAENLIPKVQASQFGGRLMAVPQGRTEDEWLCCAVCMLALPIHTLGISRRYTNFSGPKRRRAVQLLRDACETTGRLEVKLHLLGCAGYPETDVAPNLPAPWVQGVDSSLAAQFTAAGSRLVRGAERPRTSRFDFHNEYDSDLLRDNLRAWRFLCTAP